MVRTSEGRLRENLRTMSYRVKTSVFEGPLDLLLQLILRHQVDVASVSLSDIVGEYLAHLEEMTRLELEFTSEFLLIAATLIQLKVRSLLPAGEPLDLDDEIQLMEERDRLLVRLLQCVTFKDVAAVIDARLQKGNRFVARAGGLDVKLEPAQVDFTLPVGAGELASLAARALTETTPDLDHLDLDLPSVQAALEELRTRVAGEAETTFEDLVLHCTRKVEVAAYFLALLELARWGLVEVSQDDWLAEIEVRHRSSAAGEVVSEWSS